MWREKESRFEFGSKGMWALAIGASIGLAAGIILATRSGLLRRARSGSFERALALVEDQIVELLSFDSVLGQRAVEVAALAPGIVELTGTVDSEEEAHRAVELAQRATGVRTVLNRIDVAPTESRLAGNRKRFETTTADGAQHWYGMGVGMGRRRQGPTDPARRDDSQAMVSNDLDVDSRPAE
jgi:hypothetical protein